LAFGFTGGTLGTVRVWEIRMADEIVDIGDVNTDAGSSPDVTVTNPAADSAVKSKDFGAFQAAKRAERLQSLGVTDQPKPGASATPADDKPAAAAGQTDDKSGTGEQPKPGQGRGKERRIPQLDADIQDRLRRRAELAQEIAREEGRLEALRQPTAPKQDARQAAPSTAKAGEDHEPQLADFEADPAKYPDPYTAYVRAVGRWEARSELREQEQARSQREATERQQAARVERVTTFQQRVAEAATADPESVESIDQRLLTLKPLSNLGPGEVPNALNALAEAFVASDNPIGLMRYFSDNPAEVVRVGKLQPDQFYQAIGRIEAGLAKSTPAAAVQPKQKTSAPPPPTTLGQRASESGDPLENAVKRKDFTAFQAAKRRAKMAELGLAR
jgi:hypothetical protein